MFYVFDYQSNVISIAQVPSVLKPCSFSKPTFLNIYLACRLNTWAESIWFYLTPLLIWSLPFWHVLSVPYTATWLAYTVNFTWGHGPLSALGSYIRGFGFQRNSWVMKQQKSFIEWFYRKTNSKSMTIKATKCNYCAAFTAFTDCHPAALFRVPTSDSKKFIWSSGPS